MPGGQPVPPPGGPNDLPIGILLVSGLGLSWRQVETANSAFRT
uniref:Uncharacterized protein n=1 Tax=Arundo donax TaxID=35708 RepID=A0A0A9E5A4_ARUDO